jgi:osmoprotectant transport system substrate-binding protein
VDRFRYGAARRATRPFLIPAIAAILLLTLGTAVAAPAVVAASKIDTEGALLGNMILVMLGDHGIAVRNRLQLGPTNIVRAAILAGQIDIYPEYTGNGALFFHMETDPVWKSWARGYARVAALDKAKNDLVWLAPAPANNTWVIAVRKDLARRAGLRTMTDFARYVRSGGDVYLAASAEFVESPSALPAFEAAYGFELTDRQLLTLSGGNTSATLRAAAEEMSGVNAAMAYGTDGAIAALGLVVLADDQGAQIVYAPAPVVRGAVLREYPQLPGLLDPVFNSLTLDILQQLNAKIAVDGEDAGAVATGYLKSRYFLP